MPKVPTLIVPPHADEIDTVICEYILDTPAPGKQCARNALHCMKRAWEVREIDPEIAAFRAITAEEEAATAIFHSLKRWNYPGAERLDPRSHLHKAALRAFFAAVRNVFALTLPQQFKSSLEVHSEERRLKIRIDLEPFGGPAFAYFVPPLNFMLKIHELPVDIVRELHEIASARGLKTIVDDLKRRANERNRMFYASTGGIPIIESPIEKTLLQRQRHVFNALKVYLLIDPYPEPQQFVQHCLDTFLDAVQAIRRMKKEQWFDDGLGI